MNNNTSCNHNYYTNEEYIVITEPTCTEAGSYDSFLMDAADCACEDDGDEQPDAAPAAQ